MKRQGLIPTVLELRTLADELEAQIELDNLENIPTPKDIKFQFNIINKLGFSDEWEFEKSPKIFQYPYLSIISGLVWAFGLIYGIVKVSGLSEVGLV